MVAISIRILTVPASISHIPFPYRCSVIAILITARVDDAILQIIIGFKLITFKLLQISNRTFSSVVV